MWQAVKIELRGIFKPPLTFLSVLFVNSLVSWGLFLISLHSGTNTEKLLPFAAATVLLWTFADTSLTNQLVINHNRPGFSTDKHGNLRRFFLIKNLTIATLAIPICLLYGLLMVLVIGKWSELILGVAMTLVLIWGWLGISNILSVMLPFEPRPINSLLHRGKGRIRYIVLYLSPWFMLPIYAYILALPFLLGHWATGNAKATHRLAAVLLLFLMSLIIWRVGLRVVSRYSNKSSAKIWTFLAK